jgi:hypothetical protein
MSEPFIQVFRGFGGATGEGQGAEKVFRARPKPPFLASAYSEGFHFFRYP